MLYRAPTDLKFGAFTLKSAGGVQQGDPLGPLLFASTLQPLACELRAGPLDIASFFLDDGVVAGTPAVVGEAIAIGATPLASLAQHLPRELLVSADGGSRVVRSFELLGAAVGADAFVARHTSERAGKATSFWTLLRSLRTRRSGFACCASPAWSMACVAHPLLRSCQPCKSLTLEFRVALAASQAFTSLRTKLRKRLVASRRLAWACGLRQETRRLPIWHLWADVLKLAPNKTLRSTQLWVLHLLQLVRRYGSAMQLCRLLRLSRWNTHSRPSKSS